MSLFQPARGQDGYDSKKSPGLFYFLHFFVLIYGIGTVAQFVMVAHANHPHTYTRNGAAPGELYSRRYNSLFWYTCLFMCLRGYTFLVMCCMILYRQTTCCGGRSAATFWVAWLVILAATEAASFAFLTFYAATCNGLDSYDNPCNDKRWCLVPAVYMNSANGCPNHVGSATFGELRWHVLFEALYGTSVIFLVFSLVMLFLPLGLSLYANFQDGNKKKY